MAVEAGKPSTGSVKTELRENAVGLPGMLMQGIATIGPSFAISVFVLAVPTRQGVHWPQDSCSKKRIMLRAAALAVSWSDSTITAAEPMKHP